MNTPTTGRERPNRAPSKPAPVKAGGGRRKAAPSIAMPQQPPMTPEEVRQEEHILAVLKGMTVKLRQRNLQSAVLLAQHAAQHGGELEEHFAELGRRFDYLLDAVPVRAAPALRVVEGGAA